jgi:heterotetrameric sarcosine oxidase gamma subunit
MAAGEAEIAGVRGRHFRISFSGELAYEVAVPAHHATAVWQAILEAGAAFDIRPYGLDALNLLRIEKGHVAGSELNGQTTAGDLGLGRMLKKTGDFIGRALAERPGLRDPARLGLVGVRVIGDQPLKAGAHLVADASSKASQGYVTAACPSTEGAGFIGLALVSGGAARIGERLHATDPVRRQHCDVEVVSPHVVDPGNERVRGARPLGPSPREAAGRAGVGGNDGERATPSPRPSPLPAASGGRGEAGMVAPDFESETVEEVFPSPREAAGRGKGGVAATTLERDVVEIAGTLGEGWPIAPGRVLRLGPRRPPGASAKEAKAAQPGAAVIDQSGAFETLRIAGPDVLWVLSKICRLDLAPRSFGQRRVARTIIAQVPAVVYCEDPGAVFVLLVPRTFGHAFRHALSAAAADVGISFEDVAP